MHTVSKVPTGPCRLHIQPLPGGTYLLTESLTRSLLAGQSTPSAPLFVRSPDAGPALACAAHGRTLRLALPLSASPASHSLASACGAAVVPDASLPQPAETVLDLFSPIAFEPLARAARAALPASAKVVCAVPYEWMAAAFKSLGAEALLVTSSQPDAVAAAQDILRHEGIALGTVTSSLVASALRYCRSASAPCDVLVMAVDSPCSHPQLPQASQQPHKCGKVGIETALIHAGQEPDPTTGAINVPIYASSTYVQQSPGIHRGYEYSRTGNPTRHAYEECLAVLEGGGAGFAFASGLAASTTLLEMLEQGCHVVLSDDCYGGTFRLFNCKAKSTGMTITRVNMTNPENTKAAINEKTRLVWIETPTNPMLNLVPLKATLEAIRSTPNGASIVAVVDNTFASPVLQNPLQYGYDVVIHSSTKYIAGHSDIVGGAIIVNKDREEMTQRIKFLSNALGGIASPFDSYLSLRGLKTLHVRMERHCSNAMKIAQWLTSHPAVETVIYPGLPSHPQHALARDQMRDFGGMIAVILKGDLSRARRFLERCKLFALAESLGGVESLIESPAVMTHAVLGPEKRRELGILDGMVRLSVGIENVEDLIADLQYALAD